jgi:hypothetical protein
MISKFIPAQNKIFTAETPRTRRRKSLFGGEIPPNKKVPVVLILSLLYLPELIIRLDRNPEGRRFLIQSPSLPWRDWIRRKICLCDLCGSAVNLILKQA